MSLSTGAERFFQTSQSIEETDRRARKSVNTHGNPIKLPSKILAVIQDPTDNDAIYVAESAATIRRVLVATGDISRTYKGPVAPLTSICFSLNNQKLFAGCWDKAIWSWETKTGKVKTQYRGHTDFVKTVLSVLTPDNHELLISGGAEGDILIWDPSSRTRLHTIKGQSRGITHLVLDAFAPYQSPVLFAATSERGIHSITLPSYSCLKSAVVSPPIVAHATSVYRILFDEDGDLWTASADKTVKRLSREAGWRADTELVHPDFVRDIVVHEKGGWIVTACRDEEVRVWDRASKKLHHTFSGHFEEVTGLCLLGDVVVSVSIDATVRRWSLAPRDLQSAVRAARDSEEIEEVAEAKPDQNSMLTEEEEKELREFMQNEEQELQELMASDEQ